MNRVYLASPLFDAAEVALVRQVEEVLAAKGLQVFSPRLSEVGNRPGRGTRHWSIETFRDDIKWLDWCECVVAIYHGFYSDSGTAFELGYAFATNKPIVLIHVGPNSNLMCHEGAHANITLDELAGYDFAAMPTSFYSGKMTVL